MIILVSGGSKCGKSSYAESLFADLHGDKIYLAAMLPFGDEAKAAIERHRNMRSGKGFSTVERFTDIGGAKIPDGAGVLLEDMGNLLANEMFSEDGSGAGGCAERIISGIETLASAAALLVIVTNNVCADGREYPESTALYIERLSEINRRIAGISDSVVECVYGIPVLISGGRDKP